MKKLPRISESEWQVMLVLWSQNGMTTNEVVEQLQGKAQWKPKTVKTLIDRLLQKGAVRFTREGRRYRYYPVVSRDACVASERNSFVRRVYDGSMKPMLAALLEDAKLSSEDIAELREILDQKAEE